ncbi:MAG: 16S rRNA (cytidine(1402)-2'-O)-methyltransferase [Kiritimatiellaeota bacterium]|nr:16S rRNA (cytidine(1402)-2'-O)-methyltransferase [Kiritimatiellota bacterium]
MLHIVATPIGNLADLSPRALDALKTADLIACEDTRRTWALLSAFNVPRPEMISYRQGNEDRTAERILRAAQDGRNVALCSDGGYPGISDPGYRLIRRAAQENVPYDILPGATAVETALLMSGLPTSSYTFKGFPPRKPGALRRFFEEEKDMPHTLICFESPFRIAAALKAAHDVLGDREAAVCIELTKAHERVTRGYLTALIPQFDGKPVKGEVTLVLAGNNPKFSRADEEGA